MAMPVHSQESRSTRSIVAKGQGIEDAKRAKLSFDARRRIALFLCGDRYRAKCLHEPTDANTNDRAADGCSDSHCECIPRKEIPVGDDGAFAIRPNQGFSGAE